MTHFTDLELQRWRASGPGADRERVVHHVAECAACATRYAEAIRLGDVADGPFREDVRDFVAAGRAIGPRAATPLWRRPWIVSLAAAAALTIGVVVPRFVSRPADEAPAVLRGAAVQALTPSGTVDVPGLSFAWSSGVASPRVRIDVGDASGVLQTIDATTSPTPLPAAILDRLTPGQEYWWRVTLLDERGAAITSSPRRTFAIAAR